jgi:hypothetical protein
MILDPSPKPRRVRRREALKPGGDVVIFSRFQIGQRGPRSGSWAAGVP